jgi:hypothetical protein
MALSRAGPSPIEWLLIAALVALTHHYFWLMDDAFIYFRYIDNWLFLDRGLVFNFGEYVEGFTSPAWLLLLAVLRLSEIDYWTLVRGLALAAAATFGFALVWLNRALSPPGPRINFPLAASALHYGTTSHFSGGLETPLVQLLACAYAAATLRPRSKWLQAMVAASPLVRPELALCALLWGAWWVLQRRRVPWAFVASLLLVNGGWLAFRIHYYADLFPNTFYLKDGTSWEQGLHYLRNMLDAHHLSWVLGGVLALSVWQRRSLHADAEALRWPRVLMAAIAGSYTLYVVRVGGDMLYYRYLAFPFCLALCASGGVLEAVLATLRQARWRTLTATTLSGAIAGFFFAGYPDQHLSHPLSLKTKTRHVHSISDAMWHRRHSNLKPSARRAREDAKLRRKYARAPEHARVHSFVLLHPWCRRAWWSFDRYVVHTFGLTDAFLARLPAPWGRPGHKQMRKEAQQLAALRAKDGIRRERGSVARWIQMEKTPRWIRKNRAQLEVIERKIYNRHDFRENLTLAFTRVKLKR